MPTDVARTIAQELTAHVETELLFRDDETELFLFSPSHNLAICAEFTTSRGDSSRLYYRKKQASRDDVHRVLGDILWKRRSAIYLGTTKGNLSLRDLDISRFIYHGDRLEMIDEWKDFRERGIRRNVLLQGPPGCGKTTLCAHAARELGKRVILVAPELAAQSSLMEWTELLAMLTPYQTCQEIQLSSHDYHGPLLAHLDKWRAFAEMGYRRNVLLQRPPGCGKSTFCMHAARELSKRALIFTPEYCGMLRCGTWQNIIEFLDPEMLIIDDVDRVNEHSLETNLRLFEEGFCEVPFVFFTTNDHHKLPRPMRRTGRIDQIIEVEPPSQKLRWQLIDDMAAREGIDQVPDDHLRRLDDILLQQSTAHLVEALRRARVLGWDEAYGGSGDTTFEESSVGVGEELAAESPIATSCSI